MTSEWVAMSRAPDRRVTWVLGGVLLLAALLRLLEAWKTPTYFEEIYVVLVARHPLRDVLRVAADDIHPPLHFVLRWGWQRLGGESDLWLKTLSMVCALGGIAVAWALGRRMFGTTAALIGGLLLAVNADHVRFSQEVQVYAPLWLFLALTAWFGWRRVRQGRARDALGYVAAALAAIYTDYLAVFVLAPIAIWGAVVLRRDRRAGIAWVGLHAGIALAFFPQLITWVRQHGHEGGGSLFFPLMTFADLFSLWRVIAFRANYLIPVFVLLAALPLVRGSKRADAALLAMLATLPLFGTLFWPFSATRDFLYAEPFVMLLVGAGIAGLPMRVPRALLGAGLVVMGLRECRLHRPYPEAVQLERVAGIIAAEHAPRDIVVHAESHSLLFFCFHSPGCRERILVEPGGRVPYYEGGLVIPDSLYMTPAVWTRERAAGTGWWGVALGRAVMVGGKPRRADHWAGSQFDAAAPGRAHHFPPVTFWRGGT